MFLKKIDILNKRSSVSIGNFTKTAFLSMIYFKQQYTLLNNSKKPKPAQKSEARLEN